MKISRSLALEIFGLKEDFSESDLKKEYRRLVKIVHPDAGGDKKLFEFIDSCKNLLINGENVSENTNETKNHKANSYKNNTKSEKENGFITLETLDKDYDYLGKYERKYNILEIRTSLLIYIRPRFRKSLEKCITVDIAIPYSQFNKISGFVKFNQTIKIPAEMQKFRKCKVRVKFLNDTFKFNVSDGDFKVIEHQRYEYVECLKSVCELHFKK